MSEDCENLKFLYIDCVRNIHLTETMPSRCFKLWDELIKCKNADLKKLILINSVSKNNDCLFIDKNFITNELNGNGK
jgi:hypothetical protein